MSPKLKLLPLFLMAGLMVGLQQNVSLAKEQLHNQAEIPILSVNVNTASAQELADVLVGVGQSKAQLIVDYRVENGRFGKLEDLLAIKGIGPATLDKNRDRIKL